MDFLSRLRELPDLETPRLRLRKLTLDDAEAMFDYARQPLVSQYCSWDFHQSIEDTKQFLEFWIGGYGKDVVRDWAVVRKSDGRMIGTGGFARLEPSGGAAEIGYVFHPDAWGQGLATELVKKVVEWGFECDDLHRIIAHCRTENVASARVLEKNGFLREGHLRKAFRKFGVGVDLYGYGLLREDFPGIS